MPDQTNKPAFQPKPLPRWKPHLPTAIFLAVVGAFFGLWGGLSDPDADTWQEQFRLGRAVMTVMPVMAALFGAMMGWQEARLKGLFLAGIVFGLIMLIGGLIITYAPYGFSIVVGYLAGGAGKIWSGLIGAVLGATFGLIPFAFRIVMGLSRFSLLQEYIGDSSSKTVYLRIFRSGVFIIEQYIRRQPREGAIRGLSSKGRWERDKGRLLLFLYRDDSAVFEELGGMQAEFLQQLKGFVNYEATEFSLADFELKPKYKRESVAGTP